MIRALSDTDFAVLQRVGGKAWRDVPQPDQDSLRDLRGCVKSYGQHLQERVEVRVPLQASVSNLQLNGRIATDYWTCLWPSACGHKSYSFQLFFLVGSQRVEIGFCSGSGRSQERDPSDQRAWQEQLRKARRN